jgi:hypothetical protein
MHTLVVYESMYGNTHHVADAISRGLVGTGVGDVVVVPVDRATPELVADASLLVVGGPTHVHGMSRDSTRRAAVEQAADADRHLELDPNAEGEGLREWFDELDCAPKSAAAFDTRLEASALVTGRASKGIAKRLRRHGMELIGEPMSFLVEKDSTLGDGELVRAERWGCDLAQAFEARAADTRRPG